MTLTALEIRSILELLQRSTLQGREALETARLLMKLQAMLQAVEAGEKPNVG